MVAKEQLPSQKQLIELCLLLVVTAAAYAPVLFNFFLGDDFVHLSWLSKCIVHPSMLLHNFNHSWLEVVTTKFYRPLISVFMYTDYLLWRTNGLGFHITNLLFHLANCCFVYSITSVLTRSVPATDSLKRIFQPSFPFMAALLFGLYPLHPEAVSWITGRVDTVVTTFYLGAVWLYMKWTDKGRAPYLILSLASMALALLSKEMAITIPATLVAWEIFRRKSEPFLETLKSIAANTLAFWLLLAGYFIVRRIALGTFVGGYDNSLFFIASWSKFVSGWVHSIKMTLLPINSEVISNHNVFAIGWCIGMTLTALGLVKAIFLPSWRRTTGLVAAFTAISIIPVYKIFSISTNLESSRLVYLTSSFLCILIALGISCLFNRAGSNVPIDATEATEETKNVKVIATLRLSVCIIFLICAFELLWRNNLVWRDAGLECTAIRANLEELCQSLPANAHLLLIGLPDQLHGAYVCRNATPGVIERPQFSKDLTDCIFLNSYDPVFPFGYLKRSLQENSSAVNIFFWNTETQHFEKVKLPTKVLSDTSENNGNRSYELSNAQIPGWTSDFILVTPTNKSAEGNEALPVISFKNAICKTYNGQNQVQAAHATVGNQSGELFSMRAKPLWACGGRAEISCKNFSGNNFEVISGQRIMPILDFPNSGYLGCKGFLHLSSAHPSETLRCVQNDVANADHFNLEILRANLFLNPAEQNGTESSNQMLKEISGNGRTGTLVVRQSDFSGPGLYQVRLWSVDKTNRHLGVAGDHIIVNVEP